MQGACFPNAQSETIQGDGIFGEWVSHTFWKQESSQSGHGAAEEPGITKRFWKQFAILFYNKVITKLLLNMKLP